MYFGPLALLGASVVPVVVGLTFFRPMTIAILRDLRFARLLHFIALATLGASLLLREASTPGKTPWLDLALRFTLFCIALVYVAVFAIVTNNIEDLETDRITNRDRPLVRGDVAARPYFFAGAACLGFGLALGWLTQPAIFWALGGVSAVYVTYSCRPLRLKRIPILAKLLFGVNALLIAVCGYTMAGGEPRLFPVAWAVYLLVPLSLAANFVDLKDTEGDRQMGVLTLPVLLGEPRARLVIAAATFLTYAMAAVLLDVAWFYPVIAVLALLHIYFVMRQPYREVFVFLVYLSGMFALSLVLILTRPAGVNAAIAAARSYLSTLQASDGAIRDPNNPLFDVWETTEAATALLDTGPAEAPVLGRALAFLRANENSKGLLCHNQKCRAAYCLETSAEYLLLLARIEGAAAIKTRAEAIFALQKEHGEWEIGNPAVKEQTQFPSVTAFALSLFDLAGQEPDPRGMAWLTRAQTQEGHFGTAWEYYASPGYALWPAMRVFAGTPVAAQPSQRAEAFIREAQQRDGSWYYRDPSLLKAPSAELQTALMLSALRYGDRERNRDAMARGIRFLLEQQRDDGSWEGGDFPIPNQRYQKLETVFATARALSVLGWFQSVQP